MKQNFYAAVIYQVVNAETRDASRVDKDHVQLSLLLLKMIMEIQGTLEKKSNCYSNQWRCRGPLHTYAPNLQGVWKEKYDFEVGKEFVIMRHTAHPMPDGPWSAKEWWNVEVY